MFLIGWITGVVTVFLFFLYVALKPKGKFVYAKDEQEAIDLIMRMLNSNQEIRDSVKQRLNACD
jgi:hypothetical protein